MGLQRVKHDGATSTIFFWWFQHSPVNGCSTASCNWDAPVGGDEPLSFYFAILNRKSFSSILTLPTWRSSQNPQVKGSVPQDRCYFRQPPKLLLYFWPISHTSQSSITPTPSPRRHLLKFNDFARTAHRTQKNILLTRLAVCVGRYKSGTAGWKRCTAQVYRRGCRAAITTEMPCIPQPGSSPDPTFCRGLWRFHHHRGLIDH